MSEKKGKAEAEGKRKGRLSRKKSPIAAPKPIVKVRYMKSPDIAKPVIVTSPGTSLSETLEFKGYEKPNGNGSELLLHSSGHPKIDFTAIEGATYANHHRKHYVAVYDPVSGQLDITEVKNMTVRGTIRQVGTTEDDEDPIQPTSNYSSRNALTHTFGTKKSKKMVQSRAENVLYARDANPNAANLLSEALLSSMPAAEVLPTTADGTVLDTAATIQAAKPLPIPDLTATNVSEAYPLSNLVFPPSYTSTLMSMPTSTWRETISKNLPVSTSARFVASRVAYITQAANAHPSSPSSPQTTTLNLLRYILLLTDLSRVITRFRPGKPFPPPSKWPINRQLSDQNLFPTPLLTSLLKRYCPNNNTGPTKYDLTLLHTTILALTLHIPPPSGNHGFGVLATDPTDIQQDLNLSGQDARKYFRELGCRIESASDTELATWGIGKPTAKPGEKDGGGVKTKYAKLRLPLVFPQVSKGAPPSSGRR